MEKILTDDDINLSFSKVKTEKDFFGLSPYKFARELEKIILDKLEKDDKAFEN